MKINIFIKDNVNNINVFTSGLDELALRGTALMLKSNISTNENLLSVIRAISVIKSACNMQERMVQYRKFSDLTDSTFDSIKDMKMIDFFYIDQ